MQAHGRHGKSRAVARLNLCKSALMLMALITPLAAQAQESRVPLKIVVSFAAGGALDIGARVLVPELSARLKQPVIVDNRPGGNATIGAFAVANAPPDGNSVYLQAVSVLTPVFIKDYPIDFMQDFEPVSPVSKLPFGLFINASLPVKNVDEFIAYAKANPGRLNYAQSTSSTMLTMEMFKQRAGIQLVAIPYKGSGPGSTALVANEVQASFDSPGIYKQQIEAGKIRPLFTTGPQRTPVLPDVPTAIELGMPDMEVIITGGFWTRKGAPRAAIERLNAASNETLQQPEVVQKFATLGWNTWTGTPADLRQQTLKEMAFWVKAAKVANYTAP